MLGARSRLLPLRHRRGAELQRPALGGRGLTLAIAILGLNIVTGYSGQISVGHSAFFGIGAYTTMILVADHGWPFLATLPVAGALGFIVGFVLGIPALQIRGLYLALITLGLALAFPAIVKSDNFFGIDFAASTGGSNGMTITSGDVTSIDGFRWAPPSWAPDGWSTNDWVFTTRLRRRARALRADLEPVRSRVGRGMIAMRDNETGAAVSGVYPAQYKVLAFATSALVTAVGGGCFSLAVTTIGPDTFGLQRSIEFIAGLVIGGVATIIGPAIGGLLVDWLPHLSFEGEFQFSDITSWSIPFLPTLEGPEATILYGVILVLIIFFMPGGIVYGLRLLRSKFLLILPRLPASRASRRVAEPIEPARRRDRRIANMHPSTNHKGEASMTSRSNRIRGVLAAAVCLSLVAAACGDDDDDDAGGAATDAVDATDAAAPETTAAAGADTTAAAGADTTAAGDRHDRRVGHRPRRPTAPSRPARRSRSRPTTARPTATEALADGEPIKIAFIGPQTGPLAAFGVIGQGMKVYFDKINARRAASTVTRSSWSPRTTPTTRPGRHRPCRRRSRATRSSPRCSRSARRTSAGTRQLHADACVPQALVGTGFPAWGDPQNFPWTTGGIPSYNVESAVWIEFIKEKFPDATKIALLSFNNDFGKVYQTELNALAAGGRAGGRRRRAARADVRPHQRGDPAAGVGPGRHHRRHDVDVLHQPDDPGPPGRVHRTDHQLLHLPVDPAVHGARPARRRRTSTRSSSPRTRPTRRTPRIPAVQQYLEDVATYGPGVDPNVGNVGTGYNAAFLDRRRAATAPRRWRVA